MPKIALSMIVKDESHIIIDALENFRKYIDIEFFCICDTGSTDNTMELIQSYLKDKKLDGLVWSEKWKDFSHNRNLALNKAKEIDSDYILIMDADDRFVGNYYIDKDLMEADIFDLKFKSPLKSEDILDNRLFYSKPILFKSKLKVQWLGIIHEFLEFDDYKSKNVNLIGSNDFYIQAGHFGARNTNLFEKCTSDLRILKEAYLNEKNILLKKRYCFYLAKTSTIDSIDCAIFYYEERLKFNDYESLEFFLASYQLVDLYKLKEGLYFVEKSLSALNLVFNYHKKIKEIPYQISLILSTKKSDFKAALDYAFCAREIRNQNCLNNFDYDDQIIKEYGIDFQVIYCLFYLKRYTEARKEIIVFRKKKFLNQNLVDTITFFEDKINVCTAREF